MSDRGNEDTQKYTYRYTRASRVTYGGEGGGGTAGSRRCYLFFVLFFFPFTCVSVTKFSSLNSLLTAEAIRYVNVDKANIMTGEEIYKINIQTWSASGTS